MKNLLTLTRILSLLIIGISLSLITWSSVKALPLQQGNTNCESLTPLICSGVEFPYGEISFADRVVSYEPSGSGGVGVPYNDPTNALGLPDNGVSDSPNVSLGNAQITCDGELVLEFLDNLLVDVPGDDLWIFEVGPAVEATDVFIGIDGQNWIALGRIEGSIRGVDIAGKVTPGQKFSFVRLCDSPDANTSGPPFAGPDIDAVGAIGTEPLQDQVKVNLKIPYCEGADTAIATVEICNNSDTAHTYDLSFDPLPANTTTCSIAGPTDFTVLDPTPVTVGPNACTPVKVQIGRPAGMNANGQVACYLATATNRDTAKGDSTSGSVQDSREWCRNCQATLSSASSGNWNNATTWSLNRVPNSSDIVQIESGHTVIGLPFTEVGALCNYGQLRSTATQDLHVAAGFISNHGQIIGLGGGAGQPGASLELRGSPFYNAGIIQAGDGGDNQGIGDRGGSVTVLGRNTTNFGTICAGKGGDFSGRGGYAHIWGKAGGPGFLINEGLLCAGDGGNNQQSGLPGGVGGTLKIISLPEVILGNGRHRAGRGTLDGEIIIEPNIISLAGAGTEVTGGHLKIFGGDDWVLDLSNINSRVISATGNITLAVGSGGAVDLRGNNRPVLAAAGQVIIASDVISLNPGINLTHIITAPGGVVTTSSQILYDVSLSGPGRTNVKSSLKKGGLLINTFGATSNEGVTLPATQLITVVDPQRVFLPAVVK